MKEKDVSFKVRRIIPSAFPPISVFEDVVGTDEFEHAFAIEAMTNNRIRDEVGKIALVKKEDRIFGPGTTPVMAAFTHIGYPSRFSDGSYGVYYAADSSATAIEETRYHRQRFLAATNEPDTRFFMREYVGHVLLPLLDITGADYTHLHDPDDYSPSQSAAYGLRKQGSNGLLYNSVRNAGGLCVAVFRPVALSPVIQAAHYEYLYSAKSRKIERVLRVSEMPLNP